MVKLGSPFIKYSSTHDGGSIKIKEDGTVKVDSKKMSSSPLLLPFIVPGLTIRDYVKRKIFKATKEEVSHLLKSTSNLNIAASKAAPVKTKVKKLSKEEVASLKKWSSQVIPNQPLNQSKKHDNDQLDLSIEAIDSSRQNSTTNRDEPPKELKEEPRNMGSDEAQPAVMDVEPSTEQITEPVVKIKSSIRRKFSLSKKSKNQRSEDESGPSLSVSSDSERKSIKLGKKSKPPRVTICDPKTSKVEKPGKKDKKSKGNVEVDNEKAEKAPKVKWTKRMKKIAIRTCRYLGYGAQMVSPMAHYTDIPMPVTLDSYDNVYPPYYGSNPYYSYSSCGSVYGYKVSHYGFTY